MISKGQIKQVGTIALASSILLSLLSAVAQAADSSLIESALEGKSSEETYLPSAPPKPGISKTNDLDKKSPTQSKEQKLQQSSPVIFSPPQGSAKEPDEPKAFIDQQPIHSMIRATEQKVLGVQYGVKVDKSHAVDPTYRGKPALPQVQTVTLGTPNWAIQPKKKIASGAAIPATTQAPVAVPANPAVDLEKREAVPTATLNVRISVAVPFRPQDSVWAYPYPPKPPKRIQINPIPEDKDALKQVLLQIGYSARPDTNRPYPIGGWRIIHAFETAKKKAGVGVPHTMLTMYSWVDKLYPYFESEVRELNSIEEKRAIAYDTLMADYDRIHTDIEAQSVTRGLAPIEIKVNPRGVGQYQLPAGHWWIAATRKTPGLKLYWQVPVTCSKEQVVNVQMNEANALIIGGGW
ncbi:MAG: hypothetical protein K2X27_20955 [Candidatus Obscuribacterales bacterium]|nr:hypothetical protein [Candidatus Obscuribacterales bacterium]